MSSTYKKCIVLDLDNTLWGGVVGEDGIDGILLSHDERGAGFVAFQQALLDLYHRGILLAINSHNNPDDALAVIRTHPNMILKEQHFAAQRINWDDKAQNIRSLADELNIGLDAMVFFDDNPLHRESVRAFIPEVDVPELSSDPNTYAKLLLSLPYFPQNAVTNEDTLRNNLYVTERLRIEAEKRFESKDGFLASLGLEAFFTVNDETTLERVAQLTDKTNQFNTDKHPLTADEIRARMHDGKTLVITMRVTDRFGDYGLIGVAIIDTSESLWHIEQLLMSCRILSRGADDALIGMIARLAATAGASGITIAYTQTEKNIPARTFLDRVFDEKLSIDLTAVYVQIPSWFTTHLTTPL